MQHLLYSCMHLAKNIMKDNRIVETGLYNSSKIAIKSGNSLIRTGIIITAMTILLLIILQLNKVPEINAFLIYDWIAYIFIFYTAALALILVIMGVSNRVYARKAESADYKNRKEQIVLCIDEPKIKGKYIAFIKMEKCPKCEKEFGLDLPFFCPYCGTSLESNIKNPDVSE